VSKKTNRDYNITKDSFIGQTMVVMATYPLEEESKSEMTKCKTCQLVS